MSSGGSGGSMRSHHRQRIPPLALRSLKAYCSDFSTLSLAMRMQFFARPLNPFASLKTLSQCMLLLLVHAEARYL